MASDGIRYLIDTSVWARLATDASIVEALKKVVDLANPDDVLLCPPIAAEVGFSARSGPDHSMLIAQLDAFPDCNEHPSVADALIIQNRLWHGGLLRAAGAFDTVIAAYAIKNDATLLHYDRDFEHIAAVSPELRHRWIVPPGSVN